MERTWAKLNPSGEGSASAALSPVLSRQNTANSGALAAPSRAQLLRRTSSINAPSIVGVLGGKTDTTVELPWDEKLYEEMKAENEKEGRTGYCPIAAVRQRIEQLAFLDQLKQEDAKMKKKFADRFPEDIPHIDDLPSDVLHWIKFKNAK